MTLYEKKFSKIDIDESTMPFITFTLKLGKKTYHYNRYMDWWQDSKGTVYRFANAEDKEEMKRKQKLYEDSITE